MRDMKYRYALLKTTFDSIESFGIAVVCDCDDGAILIDTYSDISFDRERIVTLIEQCNSEDLDPIHLPYVVEDFLIS